MSRRKRSPAAPRPSQPGAPREAKPASRAAQRTSEPSRQAAKPARAKPARQIAADTGVLIAVLAVVTVVAELAGAANLGVSLGIGTIAFTIVLMFLMLRR